MPVTPSRIAQALLYLAGKTRARFLPSAGAPL